MVKLREGVLPRRAQQVLHAHLPLLPALPLAAALPRQPAPRAAALLAGAVVAEGGLAADGGAHGAARLAAQRACLAPHAAAASAAGRLPRRRPARALVAGGPLLLIRQRAQRQPAVQAAEPAELGPQLHLHGGRAGAAAGHAKRRRPRRPRRRAAGGGRQQLAAERAPPQPAAPLVPPLQQRGRHGRGAGPLPCCHGPGARLPHLARQRVPAVCRAPRAGAAGEGGGGGVGQRRAQRAPPHRALPPAGPVALRARRGARPRQAQRAGRQLRLRAGALQVQRHGQLGHLRPWQRQRRQRREGHCWQRWLRCLPVPGQHQPCPPARPHPQRWPFAALRRSRPAALRPSPARPRACLEEK